METDLTLELTVQQTIEYFAVKVRMVGPIKVQHTGCLRGVHFFQIDKTWLDIDNLQFSRFEQEVLEWCLEHLGKDSWSVTNCENFTVIKISDLNKAFEFKMRWV